MLKSKCSRRFAGPAEPHGNRPVQSPQQSAHQSAQHLNVESIESENRGFNLISRRPHAEGPPTFVEVRFIEVQGRAGVGVVALSQNEYRTAERIKHDYWL